MMLFPSGAEMRHGNHGGTQTGRRGKKLAARSHSWDIHREMIPPSLKDEWAALWVVREVLLQINKSVSQTPSGGSFNLKKRLMNAERQ